MKNKTSILSAAALVAGITLIATSSASANHGWGGGSCGWGPAPVHVVPAPVYTGTACTTVTRSHHNAWNGTSFRQSTTSCGPTFAHPAPVYVQPAPVYVRPAPVYAPPVRHHRGWGHRHHHHHVAPACPPPRSRGAAAITFRF